MTKICQFRSHGGPKTRIASDIDFDKYNFAEREGSWIDISWSR